MPSPTVHQVLDAARQLTPRQRERVINELQRMTARNQAITIARRLRGKYKLPAAEQTRMKLLLQKNAEGLLTPEERRELEEFINDFEERSLKMAEELVQTVNRAPHNGDGERE